ncbi:LysR family transcriptional regulator [Nocardia halotolerans]|uniref:LysR family transcriptional regulator n=1 Tax=Nocardia halotolerans TaxID=1755878 RepID=A0ABV8VLF6_9NOCA
MGLELRHLEVLVAIAEEGSVSRAAARLHTGQPAVSRTLAQLERALDRPLFDRTPTGCTLTEHGRLHLTRARRALAAFELAVRPSDQKPTITVGYVWAALGQLTNQVFERWNSDPRKREQLMLKRFQSRTSGVATGHADLGIARYPTPEVRHSTLLFTERRVAALRRTHPLADRPELSLRDLSQERIVLDVLSGTTTMDLWPPHMRPTRPPINAGSVDEWNHHVSLGEGTGITAESTPYIHPYPGIVYIPMTPETPRLQVFCIWEDDALAPVAAQLRDLVQQIRAEDPADHARIGSERHDLEH